LAAGVGSRWTQGAGVVKALHPFRQAGRAPSHFHRSASGQESPHRPFCGQDVPHIFSTSYLTHEPLQSYLAAENNYGYEGEILLSPGRSIGLRMVPTVRDLRFAWEEMPQQVLDERAQKVRQSLHSALIEWARSAGEASDYTDNLPASACIPSATGMRFPTCCATACCAICSTNARSCNI
jgi:hypothetical protein